MLWRTSWLWGTEGDAKLLPADKMFELDLRVGMTKGTCQEAWRPEPSFGGDWFHKALGQNLVQ